MIPTSQWWCRIAIATATVLLTAAAATAGDPGNDPLRASSRDLSSPALRAVFTLAVDDFQGQRFSAAYGRFVRLADAGDARSARIALLMFEDSLLLFRKDWDASLEQQARWVALTSRDPIARAMP